MITDAGVEEIGRYLSYELNAWASFISVGIGQKAIDAARTDLAFEISRARVFGARFDPATGTVYVRAEFADEANGPVDEIGLWGDGDDGTLDVLEFDVASETWSGNVVAGGGTTDHTYHDINGTATGDFGVEVNDEFFNQGLFRLALDLANTDATVVDILLEDSTSAHSLDIEFNVGLDSVVEATATVTGSPEDHLLFPTVTTTNGTARLYGMHCYNEAQASSVLVAIESSDIVLDRTKNLVIEMGVDL